MICNYGDQVTEALWTRLDPVGVSCKFAKRASDNVVKCLLSITEWIYLSIICYYWFFFFLWKSFYIKVHHYWWYFQDFMCVWCVKCWDVFDTALFICIYSIYNIYMHLCIICIMHFMAPRGWTLMTPIPWLLLWHHNEIHLCDLKWNASENVKISMKLGEDNSCSPQDEF